MNNTFESLKGKTLTSVTVNPTDDAIQFETTEGERFMLYHDQDCCESVSVEEIVGNLDDLVGTPLLEAEESSNQDNPPERAESHTWTFYKLGTIKGHVNIRWLGTSNGYYSEKVDFVKLD